LNGPKAMAIHPWGRVFVGRGPDLSTAEFIALKACNDDPERNGVNGPCFIYAAGNQVVLPDRRASAAGPPPVAAVAAGTERIAAVAARINPDIANIVRNEYAKLKEHKAIAVHPPTGRTFWWNGDASAAQAERSALEGCQLEHNGPCILLAVDDEQRAGDPATAAPRRMERLAYAGQFQVGMLPWNLDRKPAVLSYPGLPGGKAIAIRPHGARFAIAGGKPSNAEAERAALAECNQAGESAWPCFVYASGMQVVLPQRRTEAPR